MGSPSQTASPLQVFFQLATFLPTGWRHFTPMLKRTVLDGAVDHGRGRASDARHTKKGDYEWFLE